MATSYCGGQIVTLCEWKRVLASACCAATVAAAGTAMAGAIEQDRVRAGLWEITLMQEGTPNTSTYCITPQAAKSMNGNAATVQRYVEQGVSKENGGACTVKNFKLQGDTISLTKACGSGQSAFTITLVRTYHGDTAESEAVSMAGGRELHIKSKQRRVGACS